MLFLPSATRRQGWKEQIAMKPLWAPSPAPLWPWLPGLLARGTAAPCRRLMEAIRPQGHRLGPAALGTHAASEKVGWNDSAGRAHSQFHPQLLPKCKFRAVPLRSSDLGFVLWGGSRAEAGQRDGLQDNHSGLRCEHNHLIREQNWKRKLLLLACNHFHIDSVLKNAPK